MAHAKWCACYDRRCGALISLALSLSTKQAGAQLTSLASDVLWMANTACKGHTLFESIADVEYNNGRKSTLNTYYILLSNAQLFLVFDTTLSSHEMYKIANFEYDNERNSTPYFFLHFNEQHITVLYFRHLVVIKGE